MFGPSCIPVFDEDDPVILTASPDTAKLLVAWIKLVAEEPLK
jgi:hypothetical protein